MLHYGTYVKYSLEGMLCVLDDEFKGATSERRKAITQERMAISRDYDAFVALAEGLPRFSEALFGRIFPRRNRSGELYLGIKPVDAGEALTFLDLFEPHPLAHHEGERTVYPYTAESVAHRIFPYIFLVQLQPGVFCRVGWCYEHKKADHVFIRMHLPNAMTDEAVDKGSGTLKDRMFVAGLAPYVYVQTNETGRRIGLHFPKAYRPDSMGGFRLLTWRDIPLFADLARHEATNPTK